jgi:hypothetical protein
VFLINFYEIRRSGIGFETEDNERRCVQGDVSAADHPAKSVNFRYTPDPPCPGEAHQRVILIRLFEESAWNRDYVQKILSGTDFFKGNIHDTAMDSIITVNPVYRMIEHDRYITVINIHPYTCCLDVNKGSIF